MPADLTEHGAVIVFSGSTLLQSLLPTCISDRPSLHTSETTAEFTQVEPARCFRNSGNKTGGLCTWPTLGYTRRQCLKRAVLSTCNPRVKTYRNSYPWRLPFASPHRRASKVIPAKSCSRHLVPMLGKAECSQAVSKKSIAESSRRAIVPTN